MRKRTVRLLRGGRGDVVIGAATFSDKSESGRRPEVSEPEASSADHNTLFKVYSTVISNKDL